MDTSPPPKKLLDQLRDALRVKHYALSTENSYVDWAERFIRFHKMRHPDTMGEPEIAAFLTHLAVEENVAAPTQSQALSAILFLYRHVLHIELDGRIDLVRAKKSRHLPVVLTKAEVQAVLRHVPNEYQVMAKPSKTPCAPRASPRTLPAIASATRLPRTCWKPGTISAPCRNSSATRT